MAGGWARIEGAWWEAIAETLPKPWPHEAVMMDLRWWSDTRAGRVRPGRLVCARRWGWSDWCVRRVLRDDQEWRDPFASSDPTGAPTGRLPVKDGATPDIGRKTTGCLPGPDRSPTSRLPVEDGETSHIEQKTTGVPTGAPTSAPTGHQRPRQSPSDHRSVPDQSPTGRLPVTHGATPDIGRKTTGCLPVTGANTGPLPGPYRSPTGRLPVEDGATPDIEQKTTGVPTSRLPAHYSYTRPKPNKPNKPNKERTIHVESVPDIDVVRDAPTPINGQAFSIAAARWKQLLPGGPMPRKGRGQGVHLAARLREHGLQAVLDVLTWATESDHERAVFLRERGLSLLTLMRPANFEAYLGFARGPASRSRASPSSRGAHPPAEPTAEELEAYEAFDPDTPVASIPPSTEWQS